MCVGVKNSRRSIHSGRVMAVLPLKCYLNDKVVWLHGLRGVILYTFTRLHRERGTPARLFYAGHVSWHPTERERAPSHACTFTRVVRRGHVRGYTNIGVCIYCTCALNVCTYRHVSIYGVLACFSFLCPRFLDQFH